MKWRVKEYFDTRTELEACYPCPDVDCDRVNDAVDSVFGRLDDLVIKIGEMK